MRPHYSEAKTTQASAQFLKLDGGSMHYLKLMKLLYMLDREALNQWGRPVTNDEYYSMKLGPVLSETYDLMNGISDENSYWLKHISAPMNYKIGLLSDPGVGKLSRSEEGLIEKIFTQYKDFDRFALVDHLHETLPEWTKVTSGRVPITFASIFQALHKTPEERKEIEDELEDLWFLESSKVTIT